MLSRFPRRNQETLKRRCGHTSLATGTAGCLAIRGVLLDFANLWAILQRFSTARSHPGKLEHLHPFLRHHLLCIHGFLPASGILTCPCPCCQLTQTLQLSSRSLFLPLLLFLAA